MSKQKRRRFSGKDKILGHRKKAQWGSLDGWVKMASARGVQKANSSPGAITSYLVAPIAKECIEFLYSIGIHVYEGYGQNELGNIALSKVGKIKPGSVGKPLMEVKISEDGEVMEKKPRISWQMICSILMMTAMF